MALDTAAKRHSAINWGLPWRTAPIPDGAISQGDRQHAALMYAGILASEAQVDPIVDTDQYARFGFADTNYSRMGADETTYNRSSADDTNYARP